METSKFPYIVRLKTESLWFIPTIIDYLNEMVWIQHSQVSDNGEWIPFSELYFKKVFDFVDLTER